jgi:hypothetical protein
MIWVEMAATSDGVKALHVSEGSVLAVIRDIAYMAV